MTGGPSLRVETGDVTTPPSTSAVASPATPPVASASLAEALARWAAEAPQRAALVHTRDDFPRRGVAAAAAAFAGLAATAAVMVVFAASWALMLAAATVAGATAAAAAVALQRSEASMLFAAQFETIRYGALHAHVSRLTATLAAAGSEEGSRVLLLTPPPTAADTVSLLAALRVGGATLVIGPSVGCAGGAAHCTARLRPDLVVASRGAYVRWRLALLFCRWTRGETSGTTPPLLRIDRLPAFGSEEGGSNRAMPRHGLPTAPPSGGGGQPGPVAIVAAATRESAARAVCDDAATEVASADALRRRADAYGRALALALPRSRPFGLSSAVGPFGRDADRAPTAVGGAGAWRSLHLGSLHLALDDLLLGGTAVLHPRATVPAGGNLPLLNADNSAAAWATGAQHLINRFDINVLTAPSDGWAALAASLPGGSLRGIALGALCVAPPLPPGDGPATAPGLLSAACELMRVEQPFRPRGRGAVIWSLSRSAVPC